VERTLRKKRKKKKRKKYESSSTLKNPDQMKKKRNGKKSYLLIFTLCFRLPNMTLIKVHVKNQFPTCDSKLDWQLVPLNSPSPFYT